MMRALYVATMQHLLDAAGVRWFTPLEIADVGRVARGTDGPVELQAPPVKLYRNILTTLEVADWLRDEFGPLQVTSGWRDPDYNRAAGGEQHSLHLAFNALDLVSLDGAGPLAMADYLETHRFARFLGIGRYDWGVHLDSRGFLGRPAPARWPRREEARKAA